MSALDMLDMLDLIVHIGDDLLNKRCRKHDDAQSDVEDWRCHPNRQRSGRSLKKY